MQEFIEQLGINWKLLVSQAVNFTLLVVVLRIFVYKPVLNILRDRRRKIEEGLTKAAEADIRLNEIDVIAKSRLKEAEGEALLVLRRTETQAKEREVELLEQAKVKEKELMEKTAQLLESQRQEAQEKTRTEAVTLIKRAIEKTVELDPKHIDEALIKKALEQIPQKS